LEKISRTKKQNKVVFAHKVGRLNIGCQRPRCHGKGHRHHETGTGIAMQD